MFRCIVHSLTGLWCPGCGVQRALLALWHGDIAAAWHYNQLFVAALPLVAVLLFMEYVMKKKALLQKYILSPLGITLMIAVVAAFTLWRNLQ